ncbi:MAG TPA: AAA family ATPase [Chloroflexia bacterium]|nr:AAA family ATPase [Chloroflexia bacterium]
MSCNNRRKNFLGKVSSAEGAVATTLGGGDAAAAHQVLEGVYQRAGWEGGVAPSDKIRKQMERDATALFLEFKQAGLDLPTHSKPQPGQLVALPDFPTTCKYAAVYQTLKAARQHKPLPPLAQALVNRRDAIRSSANDAKGYHRCTNCGQFTSQYREHTCPRTATVATMERHLRHRLGVPQGCYTDSQGNNLLQDLIKEAQSNKDGLVTVYHPATGARLQATLDGALMAVRQGYLPEAWKLHPETSQVVTPKGQVVTVANPRGLPQPTPANPVEEMAVTYGLDPAWVAKVTAEKDKALSTWVHFGTALRSTKKADYNHMQALAAQKLGAETGLSAGAIYGWARRNNFNVLEVAAALKGKPGGIGVLRTDIQQNSADWQKPAPTVNPAGATSLDLGALANQAATPTPQSERELDAAFALASRVDKLGSVNWLTTNLEMNDPATEGLVAVIAGGSQNKQYDFLIGQVEGQPRNAETTLAAVLALNQAGASRLGVSDTSITKLRDAMRDQVYEEMARQNGLVATPRYTAQERREAARAFLGELANSSTLTVKAGGTVGGAPHCPTCGQFMGQNHNCPVRAMRDTAAATLAARHNLNPEAVTQWVRDHNVRLEDADTMSAFMQQDSDLLLDDVAQNVTRYSPAFSTPAATATATPQAAASPAPVTPVTPDSTASGEAAAAASSTPGDGSASFGAFVMSNFASSVSANELMKDYHLSARGAEMLDDALKAGRLSANEVAGLVQVARSLQSAEDARIGYPVNSVQIEAALNSLKANASAATPQTVELTDGSLYDMGRFTGTEFRKGHGEVPLYFNPTKTMPGFTTLPAAGEGSDDPAYWSSARTKGLYPPPPKSKGQGIKYGRTLVSAATLLADARVETLPDGKIELYDSDATWEGTGQTRQGLLAVYDPATNRAGDTLGNDNASAYQMAAIMADMALNPRNELERAFADDLNGYLSGNPAYNGLKVSDGAYIAIRDRFRRGQSFILGSKLSGGVTNCPNCGQFVGQTPHSCPTAGAAVSAQAQAQSSARTVSPQAQAQARAATAVPTLEPVQVQAPAQDEQAEAATEAVPEAAVAVDAAAAMAEAPAAVAPAPQPEQVATPVSGAVAREPIVIHTPAPQVVVQAPPPLDPQAFAAALSESLRAALAANAQTQAQPQPAPSGATNEELKAALDKMSEAIAALANRKPSEAEERMVAALDKMTDKMNDLTAPVAYYQPPAQAEGADGAAVPAPVPVPVVQAPAPAPAPATAPNAAAGPRERIPAPPAPERPALDERSKTGFAVDHILKYVEPVEAPDPYLMSVAPELGGQRLDPLPQYFQDLDPNYEISDDSEKAIRTVATSLQIAWNPDPAKRPKGTQFRAFAFGGTAGTGKNTTARQIAASLRLPYYEMTINKDTSLQEEIGQTVLATDPATGATVSRAQLGKLGQAAASGAVICVNELVKANPGILGALQTMMEDGYIEVAGTEAGLAGGRIPVHPSTVFIGTFNPGYDGAAPRPDGALLSRMQTLIMNAPSVDDQARRLGSEMARLFGSEVSDGAGKDDTVAKRVMAQEYKNQNPAKISKKRMETAAAFVEDIRKLAQEKVIAETSKHPAEPTPREAARFLAISEATGDPTLALEAFKVYCDPGESFDMQWSQVKQVFADHYGSDGQALNRHEAGQGPKTY